MCFFESYLCLTFVKSLMKVQFRYHSIMDNAGSQAYLQDIVERSLYAF